MPSNSIYSEASCAETFKSRLSPPSIIELSSAGAMQRDGTYSWSHTCPKGTRKWFGGIMRHNSAKDALTWTQSISQWRQRPFCILQHVLNLPTSSFHPGMRKCLPLFYYVSCMLTSPKPQHSGPPRREFFQCCRQSIWPSGSETLKRTVEASATRWVYEE